MAVDDYYDFFTYQYAHQVHLLRPQPGIPTKNSGKFTGIYYALNKAYYLPDRHTTIPFRSYETGKLKEGNGNPSSKEYDSLADYTITQDGMIELRIPWLLLQAKDPSKKEFIGDVYKDGSKASTIIDQINIGALYVDKEGKITDSFPITDKGVQTRMKGYTWKNWNTPEYRERLKQSYDLLQDLYAKY